MEDDILQLFLEDTREHLADIETDLLDIEEAGENADPELVNKVFRAAHSIKGSAGFLGLEKVRDLSHKVENVLDMIRSDELAPDPSVISVILSAFDQLEVMIENIQESEDVDISGHLETLTGLVTASLPKEEQDSVTKTKSLGLPGGKELFALTEHEIKQARKGGNHIYLVEYDLIHDVHQRDMTPLDLLKSLESSGRILDCRMDIAAVGSLDDDPTNRIPFYILYASILEPDLIQSVFQVSDDYINVITPETETTRTDTADHAEAPPAPAAPAEPAPAAPAGAGLDDVIEGFALTGSPEQATLVLDGELTIERAAAVKAALQAGLDACRTLKLDMGAAEAADVTLLQLVYAARTAGAERGVEVSLAGPPSEPVMDTYKRAGFLSLPSEQEFLLAG